MEGSHESGEKEIEKGRRRSLASEIPRDRDCALENHPLMEIKCWISFQTSVDRLKHSLRKCNFVLNCSELNSASS